MLDVRAGARGTEMTTAIAGVLIQPLKLLPSARGRLMEVQSRDDAIYPGFGQVYVTSTRPGIVKAWYRHHRQTDQIAPITGIVKLVLYDNRPDSLSHASVTEILLDESAPQLVQIPTGVWHGFKAIGSTEAFLLHLNSVPYSALAPDEDRLPADDASIPYHW
jgi:dTDP-4-dehydrorhamnose 3,5-epimerase